MEADLLQSLVWGLISGFAEFLPISAESHRLLYQKMTGIGDFAAVLRLISQAATLGALLLACRPRLSKLRRERKLARIPVRARKRQPDGRTILDARLIRLGILPAIASGVAYIMLRTYDPDLWLLALLMAVNGVILFVPERFPQGNKDSRSLSPLDGLLLGVCSAASVVPGLSGIGCAISYGRLRGADGTYILDLCLILAIPVLLVMVAVNGYFVLVAGIAVSFTRILMSVICGVVAFISAYYGIILMRFMAVKVGCSGFAYYCWGAALFSFILYLMI